MNRIGSVYLISPIAEFRQYTPDVRLTDALLRSLQNSLQWTQDILRTNGIEAVTILEIAAFPIGATASSVRYYLGRPGFVSSLLSSSRKAIESTDALCLMPDAREVRSPLIESIRSIAAELGKPEVDAYAAADVDDSDFRRNLNLIDEATRHVRERAKVIMRGGRGR